jgi:hypothetical protein
MKKVILFVFFFAFLFGSCKKEEKDYTRVHFTGMVVNKLNGQAIPGAWIEFMDYSSQLSEGIIITGTTGKFDVNLDRRGYSSAQTLVCRADNYYSLAFNGYRDPSVQYIPDKKGEVKNILIELYPAAYVKFVGIRNDTSYRFVQVSHIEGHTNHVDITVDQMHPTDTSSCFLIRGGGISNSLEFNVTKQPVAGSAISTTEHYSISSAPADTTTYILNF